MKISFNWLNELLTLPSGADATEVARRLTLAGLEVESVERRGFDVTGVRVASVRGVRPHPGAEKLRIVKVSTGPGHEEEVVCGAPNVPSPESGGRVAWAAPGATLPGGVKLGRKEIRGFDSPGMLCSERELGIGEGVDGIMVLSTLPVGADVASALGIADHVFDVNVTPNRADALSHAGIAREVAALFGVPWKLPDLRSTLRSAGLLEAEGSPSDPTPSPEGTRAAVVSVDIRDAVACPRYHATVIRGVKVGPSPLTMRMRLASCGVRSLSNLVDVTNYVMLETGHPLHAFDLDRLAPLETPQLDQSRGAAIVVRRATAGESMRTLDGVERRLEAGDIVIADVRGPVALAGVMGGATSEVGPATTNVLLEAATFDPRAVRRTAKRLGMHSEASHRFERGVDAASVPLAGTRAAALMARLGGGTISGAAVDHYPAPAPPRQVSLAGSTLRRIAGFDIPSSVAAEKLRGIGIDAVARQSEADTELVATVPTFRQDITIAEDLAEEVMRLVGYDQVPARLPAGGKAPAPSPDRLADRARDLLAAAGMHEIAGWAFVPATALAALGEPALTRAIAVKNPISADYEVMRTSLLPGLAEAARRNLARGVSQSGFRLFEVGSVVLPAEGDTHHTQLDHAAGLLLGRRDDGWLKEGQPLDFFDAKQVVVDLVRGLTRDEPRFVAMSTSVAASSGSPGSGLLHPGISAEVQLASGTAAPGSAAESPSVPTGSSWATLGWVGQLHPAVALRFGLEVPAFAFDIQLDRLAQAQAAIRAVAPPRYPAVTRDISFWIDASVSADAQMAAMRAAGEGLLRHIAVLEDFRDSKFVAPGKKGMLWTLTYRADDRTLTDAEVDAAHARVVAALGAALAIQIR